MKREELKLWAKDYAKKYRWEIIGAGFVVGIISGVIGGIASSNILLNLVFSLVGTIVSFFLTIGLVKFMINVINGEKSDFKVLFSKFDNSYKQTIITGIQYYLWIFLYSLLLIVPGIIKAFSYSLVPYLLADEANKDMEPKDILKLSENMMNGHKKDLVVLELSFIGWHLLAIPTLGILEFWIMPYQQVAMTKFLLNVKEDYLNSKNK